MKTVLLLTVLCAQLLSFDAFSQYRYILPFEDYRECYTGFRSPSGDTIHTAKFASVSMLRASHSDYPKHCWVVQEGGRYGLLNQQGDYLLNSTYDSIFQREDYYSEYLPLSWIITVQRGRSGIIDFDGKEVLPAIYSKIEPYEPWLKVRNTAGKVALLDSSLNVVVPFEFEEIFCHYIADRSMDTTIVHSCFLAKKNGHFGLLRNDLLPILPFEFDAVTLTRASNDFELEQPYVRAEKNGLKGLYDFEGNVLIPCAYEGIRVVEVDNFYQKENLPMAITYLKKKQILWNLQTGNHSEAFHEIRPFMGKGIGFEKSGNWSVIDTNGSTMGNGTKHWEPEIESLSVKDSIVLVSTNSYRRPKEYQRVLYHYGNGQFSSNQANSIVRFEWNGASFCWTLSPEGTIFIYDSQLNQVNTLNQQFSQIYQDIEEYTLANDLPIPILENQDHLIGGFNAKGNIVIPQIYTRARVIMKTRSYTGRWYPNIADYFEFANDTSFAYYSLMGELIRALNFREIYPLNEQYFAAKSGKYTSILDVDYNLVLDSCNHVFQHNALNANWIPQYSRNGINDYPLFAFRNQKVVELVNGVFETVDSTRYAFKNPLQLQFEVLIDPSGTIVSPEGAQIKRYGSHYVAISGQSVDVLTSTGSVQLHLDQVKHFNSVDDHLFHCISSNYSHGIYNLHYNKWDIAMEAQEIVPIKGIQGKAKFCIRRMSVHPKWQFYSANGTLVSDLALDNALSYMGSLNLIIIDGKLGLMTERLSLLVPAEYDYISNFKNALFLRKNNVWYVSTTSFTHLSNGYTHISTRNFPKGRLVFQNNLVGVIDQNNVEVVAPISEQILLANYDLAKLLNPISREQINQFPLVSSTHPDQAKSINNRIILEASRLNTTKNDVMPLGFQYIVATKDVRKLNEWERTKSESPNYFSKSYYSCIIHSTTQKWGVNDYNDKQSTDYNNYEWKDGKLERIVLADLFKSPYYEPLLDSLIIDYANTHQLYGISCVNLEELLKTAKQHFILSPKGIVLLAINRNSSTITISYNAVRQFLKRPEEFAF